MQNNKSCTTEKTWDIIAESFHNTRRKPWKQCLTFIDDISIPITSFTYFAHGIKCLPFPQPKSIIVLLRISLNRYPAIWRNVDAH